MLLIAWRASPFHVSIFVVERVISALLPTASIFVTAEFINRSMLVYQGIGSMATVRWSVFMLVGILLYTSLANILMQMIDCRRGIYYRQRLVPLIIGMQAKLSYHHMEEAETIDLIKRVCDGFDEKVWQSLVRFTQIVYTVIFMLGIFVTLFLQVWWIAAAMFLAGIPLVFVAKIMGYQNYEAYRQMTELDRKTNYLSSIISSREAMEERTMYGYTEYVNSQFLSKFEYARKFRLKVTIKNYIRSKSATIYMIVFSVGILSMLLVVTMSGNVSIGMFAGLLVAVFNLSRHISGNAFNQLSEITLNNEYLKDLNAFMMLDQVIGATDAPAQGMDFEKIEFKDVYFTYPGTNKPVLNGCSFIIEKGKSYAFVGANGAGKTTIAKLLTGLYSNYKGDIMIDGRSLKTFTQSQLKGLTAVVYQDFARYFLTLYDNITFADVDINEEQHKLDAKIMGVISLVGLSDAVMKLEQGVHTPLGKILQGGVDISGGEWQRVAIARSLLQATPLRILDEPTAALDPIAEREVYGHFNHISKDATTIFISHRLGAVRDINKIYVLSEGRIVESGSHEELLEKDGSYTTMWNTQAKWYQNEERD